MEKLGERESVLLGLSPQTSFPTCPKSPHGNSEMDFSDVFGGPPRRFSIKEVRMRHSFNETLESEDSGLPDGSWSGLDQKPVFGAKGDSWRHLPVDDFFDDIFRGDDSKSNSPRRTSFDFFGSNPGSRVLSPVRLLPPNTEPFSPSFPAQFRELESHLPIQESVSSSMPSKLQVSLPARLTKAMDFPALGSANCSKFKSKEGIPSGMNYPHTSTVSLSRFSSQAKDLMDETRNESSIDPGTFSSSEVSHKGEESSYAAESDGGEKRDALQKESEHVEVPRNSSQFHFSIYKWAGNGVPILTPLIGSHKLRSRGRKKMESCSSSNGRMEKEFLDMKMEKMEEYIISVDSQSDSLKVNVEEAEESRKVIETNKSHVVSSKQHPQITKSEGIQDAGNAAPHDHFTQKQEESHSKHALDSKGKFDKQTYRDKEPLQKPDMKPLHALFSNEKDGKGSAMEGEGIAVTKESIANKNADTRSRKDNSNGIHPIRLVVNDISSQRLATNHGDASVKLRAEGKVREFVKIFNQETSAKPKTSSDPQSQNSRWKGIDIKGKENRTRNVAEKEENVHLPNKKTMSEVSFKDGDNFDTVKVKEDLHSKSSNKTTHGLSADEKNEPIFSDPLPGTAEAKDEDRDESFQGHFQVEELSSLIVDKDSLSTGDFADIKALDAKIHQWSSGRKGNIRSLLSTLQYVLWPESGWKTVPLVDIIEGSAVNRAYRKAMLYLHPDKLQQKGAAFYQKYTAEKVFEILQEAWDHFNSLGAI